MIGIACDQAGVHLKNHIIAHLNANGLEVMDHGTNSTEPTDYPFYAKKVSEAVLQGEISKGILICGTGIGISIAANRHKGIRAALCHDVFSAKACRLHNDANILALGARVVGSGLATEILDAFLTTEFSGDEKHLRRVNMIEL